MLATQIFAVLCPKEPMLRLFADNHDDHDDDVDDDESDEVCRQ